MAFVPFGNGVEIVVNFRIGGQTIKNVLNFVASATPDITLLGNLAKVVIDAVDASAWFASAMGNGASFESVQATSLVSSSAPSIISTHGTSVSLPHVLSGSSDPIPNNAALVVTHHTDNRGRSFRGRSYLAGLAKVSQTSPVEVSSAAVTDALALLDDIAVAALTESCVMAVFSRFSGGVERTTGLATPIGAFSCNPALDSQRRRLEGRGS